MYCQSIAVPCEVFDIVSVWFRKHIRLFPSKNEIGEKVHLVELHVWTTYYCLFIPIVRVLGALFGSSKIHYVLPVSKWVPKAHPKYVQRRVHIICKLDFFSIGTFGSVAREKYWERMRWSQLECSVQQLEIMDEGGKYRGRSLLSLLWCSNTYYFQKMLIWNGIKRTKQTNINIMEWMDQSQESYNVCHIFWN